MFFFNDTATTEIYTLSLHDALPIYRRRARNLRARRPDRRPARQHLLRRAGEKIGRDTSELQSRQYLVCRLLLEKKLEEMLNSPESLETYRESADTNTRHCNTTEYRI